MSLHNHQPSVSSNFYPFAPSSKQLRGNNYGAYPGSGPLSSSIQNPGNRLNTIPGIRTNGYVRTTIRSMRQDQEYVNAAHLIFVDNKDFDKPKMMNIQQLNQWLASEEALNQFTKMNYNQNAFSNVVKKEGKILNREEVEKTYIVTRFRLYGACVNKDADVDQEYRKGTSRVARATTVTVKGATYLLDYWSYRNNRIKPYDNCFLILKKVKADRNMTFQTKISACKHGQGTLISRNVVENSPYIWQIIPYFCTERVPPLEAYTWNTGKTVERVLNKTDKYGVEYTDTVITKDPLDQRVGYYWSIGNVHEYPDLPQFDTYNKRENPHQAVRDMVYLHDNGKLIPFQFYLQFDVSKAI